jgi:hypothetical protein
MRAVRAAPRPQPGPGPAFLHPAWAKNGLRRCRPSDSIERSSFNLARSKPPPGRFLPKTLAISIHSSFSLSRKKWLWRRRRPQGRHLAGASADAGSLRPPPFSLVFPFYSFSVTAEQQQLPIMAAGGRGRCGGAAARPFAGVRVHPRVSAPPSNGCAVVPLFPVPEGSTRRGSRDCRRPRVHLPAWFLVAARRRPSPAPRARWPRRFLPVA